MEPARALRLLEHGGALELWRAPACGCLRGHPGGICETHLKEMAAGTPEEAAAVYDRVFADNGSARWPQDLRSVPIARA